MITQNTFCLHHWNPNQWPLVCLGSYCNWQQIRQNELWSFQAGTKKRACTCLLQTSSHYVASIKTLIECLDSTATSRPFTIPKKAGIRPFKSLQVTSSHFKSLQVTSSHFKSLIFMPCHSHQLPGICGIGHVQLLPQRAEIQRLDRYQTCQLYQLQS